MNKLGYYIHCDLFEFCDQEQLIYLFGTSKKFLETKKWLTMDVKVSQKNIDEQLQSSCQENTLIQVQMLLHSHKNIDFDYGLQGACQGGHLDVVKFMIEKGATYWNGGLSSACCGGQTDVVHLMIEKGATDWNLGLSGACQGVHPDVVNLMIEKGATYCGMCRKNTSEHP